MKRAPRFRLKPPPKPREDDVESACIDLLRIRGYYVIRQQSGIFKTPDGRWVHIGTKGVPDYAAMHQIYPGFLMEVKRPGGKLSDDQIVKINEIQIGYRLAVVVIDDVAVLHHWLVEHEAKAKRRWQEQK